MLFLDTATSTGDLPCLQAFFVEVCVSESVDCCLSLESRLCFYEADHAEDGPYSILDRELCRIRLQSGGQVYALCMISHNAAVLAP
jgi:hypothetical protein